MWRGIQLISSHLLPEIIVRVVLLAVVCLMQINCQPHLQYTTEKELLRYYKRPRRDSYVPFWLIVLFVVLSPLLLISASMYITKNYLDCIQALLAWTLALSINAIITETMKLMVGRYRPDFYYRCFPDGIVTENLQCTGKLKDIIEGRKSFPSGHSSFSFCSLGFISLWLSGKLGIMSWNRGRSLVVMICFIPLFIASMVSISRYCDHHHHWEDIAVGSMLGYLCAYFCYFQHYNPLDSRLSGQPCEITNFIDKHTLEIRSLCLKQCSTTVEVKHN